MRPLVLLPVLLVAACDGGEAPSGGGADAAISVTGADRSYVRALMQRTAFDFASCPAGDRDCVLRGVSRQDTHAADILSAARAGRQQNDATLALAREASSRRTRAATATLIAQDRPLAEALRAEHLAVEAAIRDETAR